MGDPKDGKGYLRMGVTACHKDLVIGYQKVWGGGFWERDYSNRKLTLWGESGAFGEPIFSCLKRMDRDLKGYKIVYLSGSFEEEIDTSEMEWI